MYDEYEEQYGYSGLYGGGNDDDCGDDVNDGGRSGMDDEEDHFQSSGYGRKTLNKHNKRAFEDESEEPLGISSRNKYIIASYARKSNPIMEKAFEISNKLPPPKDTTDYVIEEVRKKDYKTDAKQEELQKEYLRYAISERKGDPTEVLPYYNSISKSSDHIQNVLSTTEVCPMGSERADDGERLLEEVGVADAFEDRISSDMAGLEKKEGRYALVQMSYMGENGRDLVMVRGNFVYECSPYIIYNGVLQVSKEYTESEWHFGNIERNEGRVYHFRDGLHPRYRPFDGDSVSTLFARAKPKAPDSWIQRVPEEVKSISKHREQHLLNICSGGLGICDLCNGREPHTQNLRTLEYLIEEFSREDGGQDQTDETKKVVPVTIDSLLQEEGAKIFILHECFEVIQTAFPGKISFIYKLRYDRIISLRNRILNDPFFLCFKSTKPYKFLDELDYTRLMAVREKRMESEEDHLTPTREIAIYIYHQILIPNMISFRGSSRKNKSDYFRFAALKHSENSYIEESEVIEIVTTTFTWVPPELARDALSELVRRGVVVVNYVKEDGTPIRDTKNPNGLDYPIQTNHPDAKEANALVMTTPAYVFTALLTRTLRGIAIRLARRGPVESNLLPKEELGLDESQYEVLLHMLNKPITLLTGEAGTGKTNTMRAIVKCVDPSKLMVAVLMAKTGNELTTLGLLADTMHHYIVIHHKWSQRKDGSPHPLLQYEVVIIDEATLPSLPVASKFLFIMFAFTKVKHVILAGHEWQLPSIEYGNVFVDLIEGIPEYVFRLNKFYRSKSDRILSNARKIFNYSKNVEAANLRDSAERHLKENKWNKSKSFKNDGRGYDDYDDRYGDDDPDEGYDKHIADNESTGTWDAYKGLYVPDEDMIQLDEGDDFVIEEPPDDWDTHTGKSRVIIQNLFMEAKQFYLDILNGCNEETLKDITATETSKVNKFKELVVYALKKTHILTLRNVDSNAMNQAIHECLFANGFLFGLCKPTGFYWGFMKECGIDKEKYNEEESERKAKAHPMAHGGLLELYDGPKEAENAARIASGTKSLFLGEMFYMDRNDRKKHIRNGEMLVLVGIKDVPLDQVHRYISIINVKDDDDIPADLQNKSNQVGVTPVTPPEPRNIEDLEFPENPTDGPIHIYDGIVCKVRTATITLDGNNAKIDVYSVCASWTGYQPKELVRLIKTKKENGNDAYCTTIDRVFMEYSVPKGSSAKSNVFKIRGSQDGTTSSLKLGWATTIHRYQGSEQDFILYVIGNTVDRYSTCQYAYVAVSRAKCKVKILGSRKALSLIASRLPRPRRTTLKAEVASINIPELFKRMAARVAEEKAEQEIMTSDLVAGITEDDLDFETEPERIAREMGEGLWGDDIEYDPQAPTVHNDNPIQVNHQLNQQVNTSNTSLPSTPPRTKHPSTPTKRSTSGTPPKRSTPSTPPKRITSSSPPQTMRPLSQLRNTITHANVTPLVSSPILDEETTLNSISQWESTSSHSSTPSSSSSSSGKETIGRSPRQLIVREESMDNEITIPGYSPSCAIDLTSSQASPKPVKPGISANTIRKQIMHGISTSGASDTPAGIRIIQGISSGTGTWTNTHITKPEKVTIPKRKTTETQPGKNSVRKISQPSAELIRRMNDETLYGKKGTSSTPGFKSIVPRNRTREEYLKALSDTLSVLSDED